MGDNEAENQEIRYLATKKFLLKNISPQDYSHSGTYSNFTQVKNIKIAEQKSTIACTFDMLPQTGTHCHISLVLLKTEWFVPNKLLLQREVNVVIYVLI